MYTPGCFKLHSLGRWDIRIFPLLPLRVLVLDQWFSDLTQDTFTILNTAEDPKEVRLYGI